MANIQKTLDALQPYVVGIRYLDGTPVVDAVFKEGWTLPDSNTIKKVKGNEEMNYYMLFSEQQNVGLDELLDYVDVTIKANIEKEKKHELLKEKVNELKELFKKTSLLKLQKLKFTFAEDDLVPSINEFEIEEITNEVPTVIEDTIIEPVKETESKLIEEPITEEDEEILAEERRAENFRKYQENKKSNEQLNNIRKKVELPPKAELKTFNEPSDGECDCGPDEACSKCIDKKTL